jgi:hypothetical protein
MLPLIVLKDWEEYNNYNGLYFYVEPIMYILFEAFRLWVVLDSVRKN